MVNIEYRKLFKDLPDKKMNDVTIDDKFVTNGKLPKTKGIKISERIDRSIKQSRLSFK